MICAQRTVFDPAIETGDESMRTEINLVLARFPEAILRFLLNAQIRIVTLDGRRYTDASPGLRRALAQYQGTGPDDMPSPPPGLFTWCDRTAFLHHISPLSITHELLHGLDLALGDSQYYSDDDVVAQHYSQAIGGTITIGWLNPYSCSSRDEYFCEALRAYLNLDTPDSLWPPATRERLNALDPKIERIIERALRRIPGYTTEPP